MTLPGLAMAWLLLAADPGPAASEAHLVAGAEAFRAGSYDRALVEFRVAEALGSTEAAWYSAASLLKLGRPEDAVEAFVLADRSANSGGDALLEVYRGEACYAVQLYLCADRWFESAASRAGPRLAPQLQALRSQIRGALQPEQLAAAIDRLLGRATELAGTRPALAAAYADEAVTLSARSPVRHREAEATSLATRLAAPRQKERR